MRKTEWERILNQIDEAKLQAMRQLVAVDSYSPGSVVEYIAQLDKKRWLYRYQPKDRLFHHVLALELQHRLEPLLSDSVHAYRKGRGIKTALSALLWYLREYRQKVRDPKQRALYVLRFDIQSYTDSFPLGENSILWKNLVKLGNIEPILLENLKRALRPTIEFEGRSYYTRCIGIPTGSSITPTLANFYLMEIDQWLESISGAVYCRYGDDILFVHSDVKVVREVLQFLPRKLQPLGLNINEKKMQRLCWTANGLEVEPDFNSTQSVDFIGSSIHFGEKIRLSTKKNKELMQGFSARLRSVQTDSVSKEEQLSLFIQCSNLFFDPSSAFCGPHVIDLYSVVNDASYIRYLEFWAAKKIVQSFTGVSSNFAFRNCSWEKLLSYRWRSPFHFWLISRRER